MIKKIFGIHFSKKLMCILSLLALVLALLPLYRLTLYAVPRYDDYSYGLNMWKAQRYGYGLRTIIDVGYETAVGFRYAWQGTYFSIFMMAQMPGALGFDHYFIGPVLLISSLVISVFFMSMVLTGAFLKADIFDRITFSVIVTLTLTECIYTAQQGFFWYNSGVHYVFMHSLMFLLVGFMVLIMKSKHIWFSFICAVFTAALSFACAGANYVTCIQGILLLSGVIVIILITSPKKVIWYLPAFFLYVHGLRLNVTAPGNAHRQASYQGYGAIKSVAESLHAGVFNMWKFSGWFVVLLMLLAVPVIFMMVKNTAFTFRFPLIFSILSYCFYCTGYTSSFYSMGNAGLSRTWIAVCFSFQVLLFANEIYWLGYIAHNKKIMAFLKKILRFGAEHYILYYAAVFVLLLTAFHYTADKIGAVSSFGAYYYVHSGEAYAFRLQFDERVRMIQEADHNEIVTVPEYAYKPWFLINRDISEDPDEEENRIMSDYFGIRGIRAIPREQFYGE